MSFRKRILGKKKALKRGYHRERVTRTLREAWSWVRVIQTIASRGVRGRNQEKGAKEGNQT